MTDKRLVIQAIAAPLIRAQSNDETQFLSLHNLHPPHQDCSKSSEVPNENVERSSLRVGPYQQKPRSLLISSAVMHLHHHASENLSHELHLKQVYHIIRSTGQLKENLKLL